MDRAGAPGGPDARGGAVRALEGERPLGRLRQGAAALQGPGGPRVLPRPHPRRGHHRPRAAGGALLPAAPAEPLPDPGQVPRRDPPALRADARPRVLHEGRLLLRRGRGGGDGVVPEDVRGLLPDLPPDGARLPRRRGRHRQHRRLELARVHGDRRLRRGRDRLLRLLRLRGERREGGVPAAAAPKGPWARRRRGRRARSPRPASGRSRRCRPSSRSIPRALIKTLLFETSVGDVAVLVSGRPRGERDQGEEPPRRRVRPAGRGGARAAS